MKSEKRRNKGISIHVPSWGTTELDKLNFKFVLFQSTFPRGERQIHFGICDHSKKFQSTFPRGERPGDRSGNIRGDENFNPRSLVGNDYKLRYFSPHLSISIHVPSWGTTTCYHLSDVSMRFQSTFPRGERPNIGVSSAIPNYFNPRSLVGNDKIPLYCLHLSIIFQSTFPRGERRFSKLSFCSPHKFQSTFPRGERLRNLRP